MYVHTYYWLSHCGYSWTEIITWHRFCCCECGYWVRSQWVTVKVECFFSISVCIHCDHCVSAASRPLRRWLSHIDWRRTRWSRTQRRDWRTANPGGSLTTSWSCTAPRSSPLLLPTPFQFPLEVLQSWISHQLFLCFNLRPTDRSDWMNCWRSTRAQPT